MSVIDKINANHSANLTAQNTNRIEAIANADAHTNNVGLPTYSELVEALNILLPLAKSRAEDMHEVAGDESPLWKAANNAVQDAETLLAK